MRMEDLIYLLVSIAVGVLLVVLGYLIWIKEKISLIHAYHYANVKDTDKKAYTALVGKSVVTIGAGIILNGIARMIIPMLKNGNMLVFGVLFVIGMVMFVYAQMKYNHGIF